MSRWVQRIPLYSLLLGVEAERAKGVFLTDQGPTAYNMANGVLTQSTLVESHDSRFEIISSNPESFAGLEISTRVWRVSASKLAARSLNQSGTAPSRWLSCASNRESGRTRPPG